MLSSVLMTYFHFMIKITVKKERVSIFPAYNGLRYFCAFSPCSQRCPVTGKFLHEIFHED